MKIAFLSDGIFPFVVGGMQKHTYYLAKYLAQAHVHVDLYFTYPADLEAEALETTLFSAQESDYINVHPVEGTASFSFPGHYVWESYRNSERIWNLLKQRLDVDFIYAQGFSGWYALQMKQTMGEVPPIGVNFHGLEMWQKPASPRVRLEHWLLRPFVKANIKKSDAILLLGKKLIPLIEHVIQDHHILLESANGVTENWLVPSSGLTSEVTRFVFLGRYERRKGIQELHKSILELHADHHFQFDLIGPIPTHLQLKASNVNYWGMVREEEQIRTILQQADVLVCPSYAEGLPTVILEAMASGLAIIATDVGAAGDLVTQENGWLIPAGNHVALKDAMLAAIRADNSELNKKKAASLSWVQGAYMWHRVTAKTIQGIQSVLKTHSTPSVSA